MSQHIGSLEAQAALGRLLRRIRVNEQVPGYEELVEGGRLLRERQTAASSVRKGSRTKKWPTETTGAA